jgi:hypothetical protein
MTRPSCARRMVRSICLPKAATPLRPVSLPAACVGYHLEGVGEVIPVRRLEVVYALDEHSELFVLAKSAAADS